MKKIFALIFCAAMVFSLCACGASETAAPAATETAAATEAPAAESVELVVFAAASMTETMNQIKELYEAANPNVTITYTFDSSGTLKTQIQEGAYCDLFISASPKQMNQLDISASTDVNTEGLDFVLPDTRVNLLENKVVLCTAEGNPANINSYEELAAALKAGTVLLAIGNSDVPVGQYTQKIFTYFEVDEAAVAGCLTYGTNVKEVTTAVAESTADCGIIYGTDAFSAGLSDSIVAEATADMCGQVIYPAAVLNISENQEAAAAFLEYLKTPEATAVFEAVGFTALCK